MSIQEAIKELSNVSISETPEQLCTRLTKARALLESSISVSKELLGKQEKPIGEISGARLAWDETKLEPEPGEFTKNLRKNICDAKDYGFISEVYFLDKVEQACNRIDRLSAENKDLKDYERKLEANEIVTFYQEKVKELQAENKELKGGD